MMFIPLSTQTPMPKGEDWTKVIVATGEHKEKFGFVRIHDDAVDERATKALLDTH